MKRTIIASISALLLTAGLAACGEQAQESSGQRVAGTTVKHDTQPWAGDPLAHEAGGFTRGDKASWDKALDARTQAQNEYARIGGGAR
jgi:hypothetical protein